MEALSYALQDIVGKILVWVMAEAGTPGCEVERGTNRLKVRIERLGWVGRMALKGN